MGQAIHLPGMGDVSVRQETPEAQRLGQVVQMLNVIAGQLETLIRLECGAVKRADLKTKILQAEVAANAAEQIQALKEDGEDQAR